MSLTAMKMEVCSEESGHQVVPNAPNMCITPAAPSPLPMPYPIMGDTGKLDPGCEKTFTGSGKKILNADGKVKKMSGNEAGTQKDIITFVNDGHAFFFPAPATAIQFEGQPVIITGNQGLGNVQ